MAITAMPQTAFKDALKQPADTAAIASDGRNVPLGISGPSITEDLAMTFAPLLAAAPAIQLHAVAAMAAFGLGALQFAAPKGTAAHRTVGWLWIALMTAVCLSSFFIHNLRLWGPWSPIHLLAIITLVTLPVAVGHARRHAMIRHRNAMAALFFGALMIAGAFTLMPPRIMHAVVFGP